MLLDTPDECLVYYGNELLGVLQQRRLSDLVCNPLIHVDKSIGTGLTYTAPGLVKHLALLLNGHFVVVEPEPILRGTIVDEGVIVAAFGSSVVDDDGVQVVGVLLKLTEREINGRFQFINLLLDGYLFLLKGLLDDFEGFYCFDDILVIDLDFHHLLEALVTAVL